MDSGTGDVVPLLVCLSVSSHPGRSFNRSRLNFLSARVESGRKLSDLKPESNIVAIQWNCVIELYNFSSRRERIICFSVAISRLSRSSWVAMAESL